VSARAGILVTGTEVLTGRVSDRNGPWLADRLEEVGVEAAQIAIVGDRRGDMLAALRFMAEQRLDLIVTSGGLGPTADDLTAEVVGEFQGREMVLDEALEERIAAILAGVAKRWPKIDMEAVRASNRKQAVVPRGATILEPVGTAPGLVVPPGPAEGGAGGVEEGVAGGAAEGGAGGAEGGGEGELAGGAAEGGAGGAEGGGEGGVVDGSKSEPFAAARARPREWHRKNRPTVLVLPGPPRELQPMWRTALQTEALQAALAGAVEYRRHTLRLFGIPESEIAETLRAAERDGIALERLEVTTCLRRGEVEVVTRYEPAAQPVYDAFVALVRSRHADTLFSDDGATVDEQVAATLRARGLTIATAESCTGGLLAARLTELPGSSDYLRGAVVAYANDVKTAQAGVPAALIDAHGAVSPEVALALAQGARARLGADVGVGITGVAGPGGGSEDKPVGTVCFGVAGPGQADELTRTVHLPGGRADVRDRATTVALHLVRRELRDGRAGAAPAERGRSRASS
jgi:nicotinamide-nucleotide amidase